MGHVKITKKIHNLHYVTYVFCITSRNFFQMQRHPVFSGSSDEMVLFLKFIRIIMSHFQNGA